MRDAIITYVAAFVSSSAAFRFGYAVPDAQAMLAGAASSLLAVALIALVAWAWSRSRSTRAAWHESRARALSERQSTMSGLWPLSFVVWLVFALVEWGHVLRAESIGGAL